jgi:hypothetical protein
MTVFRIELPDDLALRAKDAGLLSEAAIQQLLEDAIRRRAGRRMLEVARHIQDANVPHISDEEILSEVKAVRSAWRLREATAPRPIQTPPETDASGS